VNFLSLNITLIHWKEDGVLSIMNIIANNAVEMCILPVNAVIAESSLCFFFETYIFCSAIELHMNLVMELFIYEFD
jgi:hypothetical protein